MERVKLQAPKQDNWYRRHEREGRGGITPEPDESFVVNVDVVVVGRLL